MTNKEAIKLIQEIEEDGRNVTSKHLEALKFAIKALKDKPQGKWIKIFENPFTNGYVCPFCGHKIQVTEQFLPKVTECEACGAKMDGGEEE